LSSAEQQLSKHVFCDDGTPLRYPLSPHTASLPCMVPLQAMDCSCADAGGATGAAEDKIVCFAVETEPARVVERARLSIQKPGVDALALRPDQRIFAAGGWDGRVRVFHYSKAKPLTVLKVHVEAHELGV